MKPQITFWSGVGTVTGANFLFEYAGKKMLVDCGLLQGEKLAPVENRKPFPYEPSSIDFLFITHAHLDHVGKIPKLVKDGFKGIIYSTPETKSLASLILEDSVRLLQREATQDGVLPIYEQVDIDRAMAMWKEIPYHTVTLVSGSAGQPDALSVYLRDAGHILGSTMFEFSFTEEGKNKPTKVVFTGDLGNSPTPLLENTENLTDTNYLVMESVYGDRNHEPVGERKQKLMDVINETVKKGGTVIIPAFSLERTQVILFELNDLVEGNKIPEVPVFVDSPLATKVTEIYKRSSRFFNQEAKDQIAGGDQIFSFPRLKFTMTGQESNGIERVSGAKIIIAGSGMSTGGRVTRHEIAYLPDPKSTILLVGYQAIGTLGRQLQDGSKAVKINEQQVEVKANIETIWGYSSHKDSDHLVEFVQNTAESLKRVFVVMGEPKASLFLVQKIRDNLNVNAIMPERGKVYILD